MTFYLSKLFSMKNSFIKSYEAFEGKVCIGYVYTFAEKVNPNKLPRKILTWGWQIIAVLRNLWLALPRLPRLLYQIIVSITLYIAVL